MILSKSATWTCWGRSSTSSSRTSSWPASAPTCSNVPTAVEKAGLQPDFYFKTLNSVAYYTQEPQEVADFMKGHQRPWIAFKVLGAGAVKPRDGFELAFRMGADFLNVGMFDFQVQEDAATVRSLLAADLRRERPWRS